jgi:hypothetical protein
MIRSASFWWGLKREVSIADLERQPVTRNDRQAAEPGVPVLELACISQLNEQVPCEGLTHESLDEIGRGFSLARNKSKTTSASRRRASTTW